MLSIGAGCVNVAVAFTATSARELARGEGEGLTQTRVVCAGLVAHPCERGGSDGMRPGAPMPHDRVSRVGVDCEGYFLSMPPTITTHVED